MNFTTQRIENAHADGIWTINWTKKNMVLTGSVDETMKSWVMKANTSQNNDENSERPARRK